jgi:hypothetical protein
LILRNYLKNKLEYSNKDKRMDKCERDLILRNGLNIAGYHILSVLWRDGNFKRQSLAKYTYKYYETAKPNSACAIDEYEGAIESCLEKGIIKIITDADCSRDTERWVHDDNQYCDEEVYFEGNVNFTEKGAKLYGEIQDQLIKINRINCSRFDGIIGFKWKHKNVLSIFAKRREDIDT